jgi:hypothetical protein
VEFSTDKNDEFVLALLEQRDEFYCQISRLKETVKSYESSTGLQSAIKKQDDIIREQENEITALKQCLGRLERKVWGKSSEKFIAPDPAQRTIDFEGLERN